MRARWLTRLINDLPLSVKAFGGSAVLLISLLSTGVLVIVALTAIAERVDKVATSVVGKQTIEERLEEAVSETHLNLFRYTAWASNGVNEARLAQLREEIARNSGSAQSQASDLSKRADLTVSERVQLKKFVESWRLYMAAAAATVEVGTVDPAMGTMLLGGTDDDFQRAASHLRELTGEAHRLTRTMVDDLHSSAASSVRIIRIGGLAAILVSLGIVFFFARSIVLPVRAVTRAMRDISFGNLNFRPDATIKNREDEIGQMVSAIADFCEGMRGAREVIVRNEADLRRQNLLFDAALANMSQGLCMFDGQKNLIVSNARYAELYELDPGSIKPGIHLRDILLQRIAAGCVVGEDPEEYIKERLTGVEVRESYVKIHHLNDGRSLAISHRPLADGGWLATHDDITNIRRIEAQIAHMALHDGLTDLPNRTLFGQELEAAFKARAEGRRVAVVCLDLDKFKSVNDTLGHLVGDRLLKATSTRLIQAVGGKGMVARLSGDEFALIISDVGTQTDMEQVAQHIIDAMAEPFDLDGHHVGVGISIGVAFSTEATTNVEEIVSNADTALYRAKAEGRGVFRFFEQGMDSAVKRRSQLEMDLRQAIQDEQLTLNFQPIMDAVSRRVVAFEALLRWTHSEHGSIPPSEFIPIAEDVGLIERLGEWVIRQACLTAVDWPQDIRVAVNLSPLQFGGRDLVATVAGALTQTGLDAGRLELEITESVLLNDSEANLKILSELRHLGARVVMDDFGTGYSSLGYLRSFPFDKIKIDKSFIDEIPTNLGSGAIIRAITELATNLGMSTTAEGVESREQFDYLRLQGCTEVQGYYFSPARPADEIPALLARLTADAMRQSADGEASPARQRLPLTA
ncbi:EAL domain-containing protein [Aurantimonas sp. C2-6-R+9]|uniref:EAL domain-containing protein n=1 Tax=unclassified Aurantimonas TaxID=2638230 RepID=UPI002E19A17A|nr:MULTISPECIES: EAL domain-containing protein [unclassified Aurantimonas]MEC5290303.1 EAL domain-containing protein [Aurantimonas sp. C2-3-R2]MEC5379865.1 EAL domain-containing protein [Aurantimonas sp. C2-6-R+9]MEC5411440.1 EAL domain-containing protein [Aurantimonas sp. C2-4-R8]